MADTPRIPANLEPYVSVLGADLAVEFLCEFGGAELYLATRPAGRSRLTQLVGREKSAELAKAAEYLPSRVPLGNAWAARHLHSNGWSVAQIARKLRTSDVTVRSYLKAKQPSKPHPNQLDLF